MNSGERGQLQRQDCCCGLKMKPYRQTLSKNHPHVIMSCSEPKPSGSEHLVTTSAQDTAPLPATEDIKLKYLDCKAATGPARISLN